MILRTAGLARVDDVDERAMECLVDEAERFLLAGGHVSLTEWATMEEVERDALVQAGLRIRLTTMAEAAAAGVGR